MYPISMPMLKKKKEFLKVEISRSHFSWIIFFLFKVFFIIKDLLKNVNCTILDSSFKLNLYLKLNTDGRKSEHCQNPILHHAVKATLSNLTTGYNFQAFYNFRPKKTTYFFVVVASLNII